MWPGAHGRHPQTPGAPANGVTWRGKGSHPHANLYHFISASQTPPITGLDASQYKHSDELPDPLTCTLPPPHTTAPLLRRTTLHRFLHTHYYRLPPPLPSSVLTWLYAGQHLLCHSAPFKAVVWGRFGLHLTVQTAFSSVSLLSFMASDRDIKWFGTWDRMGRHLTENRQTGCCPAWWDLLPSVGMCNLCWHSFPCQPHCLFARHCIFTHCTPCHPFLLLFPPCLSDSHSFSQFPLLLCVSFFSPFIAFLCCSAPNLYPSSLPSPSP